MDAIEDNGEPDMTPSEESVVFHHEVSRALAQWVHVEGQLESLVLQCVPIHSRSALAAAYAAIETFHAKLRFSDNLISGTFRQSEHLARWRSAFDTASSLAGWRNKIAHGLRKAYAENAVGRRYAIVDPRPIDARLPHADGPIPPSGSLCLLDIAKITVQFHRLTVDLRNVLELLAGRSEPFPVDAVQVDSQPTIRSARNRIRAALGLQLLPSRKKSTRPP